MRLCRERQFGSGSWSCRTGLGATASHRRRQPQIHTSHQQHQPQSGPRAATLPPPGNPQSGRSTVVQASGLLLSAFCIAPRGPRRGLSQQLCWAHLTQSRCGHQSHGTSAPAPVPLIEEGQVACFRAIPASIAPLVSFQPSQLLQRRIRPFWTFLASLAFLSEPHIIHCYTTCDLPIPRSKHGYSHWHRSVNSHRRP